MLNARFREMRYQIYANPLLCRVEDGFVFCTRWGCSNQHFHHTLAFVFTYSAYAKPQATQQKAKTTKANTAAKIIVDSVLTERRQNEICQLCTFWCPFISRVRFMKC